MNTDAFIADLALARSKLQPLQPADASLRALAAAALFAICAMVFCGAAVLAPANVITPMARTGVQ